MKLKDPLFYAKILLFGEYSIIEDSMGLTIPYNYYQGKFIKASLDNKVNAKSNAALNSFKTHLLELNDKFFCFL